VVPLVAPVESNGSYRHLRVTPLDCAASDGAVAERALLRRELRSRRAALAAAQRSHAERRIVAHIAGSPWLRAGRTIGLYVASGSEVASSALRLLAQRRGARIYLPRIVDYRARRMQFVRATGAALSINRHGIAEPDGHEVCPARALSVVFLPLLGVDAHGTRLGSGAGYYDRAFAFRRHREHWHRPLLIGLAFECQRLPNIERGTHDVPLDALVTEIGITTFDSLP